ncbi:unnamed protein product [Pylaiella littoralis]
MHFFRACVFVLASSCFSSSFTPPPPPPSPPLAAAAAAVAAEATAAAARASPSTTRRSTAAVPAAPGGSLPLSPLWATPTPSPTPASPAIPVVVDGDAEAFERITLARRATKHFDRRAVPDDVLKKVLALVLRAPSGFNIQPYEVIVITSEEGKKKLSSAMLGPNRERVLEAGAAVVFASDLNSMKNVRKLTNMLREEGWPRKFIRKVPLYLSVFSTGHNRLFRFPYALAKKISFGVVRRLGKGMPTVSGAETWAFKNTMLAVQELLLAATSHGLATCPMEGFDMRRLRKALRIPVRYSVPIVVCIGYPSEEQRDFKTLRFPPNEVFHREEFGTPLEGIPSL